MMKNRKRKLIGVDWVYAPVVITGIITIIVVYAVYIQTQNILKERLRERLTSIAATAALQFNADLLDKVQDRSDLGLPELKVVTEIMNKVRDANKNLKFIYILRPTTDPNLQVFIADADTLAPLKELDENGNNILDDEENPPQPGDEYDTSELPVFAEVLNGAAVADYEINADQWGIFLSGYAPIFNEEGNLKAILGIDVEVSDFNILVRATLIPFIILSGVLLVVLLVLTYILTKIWSNRVEIVKELDHQKDELLGIVSHQLATPVSSIRWYTEMLIDGDLGKVNKDQKTHLNSMMTVAASLSDLVSMILDVSRIQLGRMHIEKQELNLSDFFKEILDIIEPKSKAKRIDFDISIPRSLPKAMLDRRYTHMTIENLLSNAVKYTPENGNITFKVEIKNQKMFCEISDTGCGIPAKDQDKIFGKLFRASNVRNNIDGNGFGLFVAKGAVEAQGGKISFLSKEGKGTTFYVELPLK